MSSNNFYFTLLDMPESERPRERLIQQGVESLSTAELLAIVLGSGTKGTPVLQLAQQLLAQYGGLEKLSDATVSELCQMKGIGWAKAVLLKAVFGLGVRVQSTRGTLRQRIETPLQAYQMLKNPYASLQQEHFIVLLQDTRGGYINHEVVSIGTLQEALVHPREVFYPAIRHKAATVILAHNHPSGDPEPSSEDFQVTERLCEAGNMLNIPVVDHIILGSHTFVSLREKGLTCFRS